ncbi:hypothetical protein [uncultured Desulfovibrio sp.]|uniref:hypothetical protein n=1 Tax=uncultured Desulfovibrio sp. TaxID=167968 RepID=UPI002803855B|nr:hypothetical protein [uncultured Desulfovibrio sp.]
MDDATSFGPLRCKLPRKPWPDAAALRFHTCGVCGRLLYEFSTPDADGTATAPPRCCGRAMNALTPVRPKGERLRYDIVGGFNNNAVLAHWQGPPPRWIALRTYTGFYLKQVPETKASPLAFPLSDEDAYAYCDRKLCRKCLYRCKKGCVLYYCFGNDEVLECPLDQTSPYFHRSGAS